MLKANNTTVFFVTATSSIIIDVNSQKFGPSTVTETSILNPSNRTSAPKKISSFQKEKTKDHRSSWSMPLGRSHPGNVSTRTTHDSALRE